MMKKYVATMIVVLMFALPALAEPVTSGTMSTGSSSKNAHRYGVLSLDVYVPYTGESDPYSPYTDTTPMISGKYFLMEHTAIEVGLEFDFRSEKDEYPVEYYGDGTHIGIYGAYVRYFGKKRISPYIKAGLAMGINSGDYYENNDQDEMDFAVIGGFGTEFFVTKELSISAEALIRLLVSPTVHLSTMTPAIKASFYFDNFL